VSPIIIIIIIIIAAAVLCRCRDVTARRLGAPVGGDTTAMRTRVRGGETRCRTASRQRGVRSVSRRAKRSAIGCSTSIIEAIADRDETAATAL